MATNSARASDLSSSAAGCPSDACTSAHVQACVPPLLPGTEAFELYTEGDKLYDAMLKAIGAARQAIRLESFIFAADEVGQEFADALAERVKAGVDVRVQIDAAGSLFWTSRSFEQYLRRQGVRLRWFHRWRWRDPLRYNRRNHRKLLVVDEDLAFLGGFNIHRENSRRHYGEGRWRDTHVAMRGSLAMQAARLFDAFWREERRWQWLSGEGAHSALVSNNSLRCQHRLHCLYVAMFEAAQERIYITTPYLVPDVRSQRVLARAASRGVDVRILVPGIIDTRLVHWAAHAGFAPLLNAGVKIYEYRPRVLHAKTAVVDGTWSTLGTANMDYRSFFTNYEVNLVTRDAALAGALERQFAADLNDAARVEPRRWMRRGRLKRGFEAIGWLARRWL